MAPDVDSVMIADPAPRYLDSLMPWFLGIKGIIKLK